MKISKAKKTPLISIIMPVYNAGDFLVEAIESIISQSYKNWELIAIDDCSTDNSWQILENFKQKDKRIKIYHNQKNLGISLTLNKALKLAKGQYIARMDGDDISTDTRLVKQVKYLQKHPKIIACGGQVERITANGETMAFKFFPTKSNECRELMYQMMPLQHATLMVRADIYKQYKYKKLTTAEDVDLLFYLLSQGQINNIKDVIYKYRKVDMSNGYHQVKKTFYITLWLRLKAIWEYNYQPSFKGVIYSLLQLILVTGLPSRWVIFLFEAIRMWPPVWQPFGFVSKQFSKYLATK